MVLSFACKCPHKSVSAAACTFRSFPKDAAKRKVWEDRRRHRRLVSGIESPSDAGSEGSAGGSFSVPSSESEVDTLRKEVDELKAEVKNLRADKAVLEAQKSSLQNNVMPMSYFQVKGTKFVYYYTGLNNETFEQLLLWLLRFDTNYAQDWTVVNVQRVDQIFLTFMKFWCNFDFLDLAFRFRISNTAVSTIFLTWLQVLHEVLFVPFLNKLPSTLKNKISLPSAFSDSKFTCCRVVADCTKMSCAVCRSSMDKSSRTFSNYKHKHTFKFLIACSPNGAITFVSEAYPGRTSDKKILADCGICDQLVVGDMVLVDKGFTIQDVVPPGVSVNMPPFLAGKQFTRQEVKLTYEIARARIIIERVNTRVKNLNILDRFPAYLRANASKMCCCKVVCAIVNFQNPLIADIPECDKEKENIVSSDDDEGEEKES